MKLIKTASGKKKIKISKSEWQNIGKKAGWGASDNDKSIADEGYREQLEYTKDDEEYQKETVIKGTPDRIENLRNIARFIIDNCPKGEDPLMHKLNGYGQQLLIIARDIQDKLKLTDFRLEENPKGWN